VDNINCSNKFFGGFPGKIFCEVHGELPNILRRFHILSLQVLSTLSTVSS